MTDIESKSAGAAPVVGIRTIVLALFLFSGASGLIYEVVWSRMFALVLGTTVYAVATVLGVFMAGLALGSWLLGRVADRPGANGLRLYALLELGIGVFALILPLLMSLSDVIYRAMWPAVEDSFAGIMVLRFALAALILIVPSTLMGGTLPVLSRFLVRTRTRTGLEIGTLYAINTLGAVLGCFVAGFFLLEYLGVRYSLLLAALLNFGVGFTALTWSRRAPAQDAETARAQPIPENVAGYDPFQVRLALLLYAFSGFAALALEVLWTRSLMYFTSVDTYAFTAMLSAFLCGLGLGSLVMARFVGRIRHPLLVLGVIEALVGISAAASIPLFAKLYGAYAGVSGIVPEATLLAKIVTKLFASFFIMLIPTLLMGAAFPLVSAIYVGARGRVGRGIGTLYALNTVGAIVGSVSAGFLLIPLFGIQKSILLCSFVYIILGLVLCAAAPQTVRLRAQVGVGAALASVVLLVYGFTFTGREMIRNSWFFMDPQRPHDFVYYDEAKTQPVYHEGPAASLAALVNKVGTKLLNINGITTAINNHKDMQVHRMLSHLPMLLHPDPQSVLIVGFGMGSTPWGCCQYPVQRVDVVELLRDEKRTAVIFEDINHGVLNHPKLNFIEGDGRNYLLATGEKYDVISFNAIHPRYSAYLYTKDFYELCRERMSEDGVICAWMTQNSMLDEEFRMLCRSFAEVFEHSSIWYCNPEHFCLIGTMQPTQIDLDDWARRMAVEGIAADLADSNLDDPAILASRYMMGGATLDEYVAGAPLNTDDKPLIEFARSSKKDERPIIERLIRLNQSVMPLLVEGTGDDAARSRLAITEQATLLLMQGQTIDWYWYDDEALKVDMDEAQRQIALGQVKIGAELRAEIAWRRALLLDPENQDIRQNLAFSDRFERRVRRELEQHPLSPAAWTRLGEVLVNQGRFREAGQALMRALELDNMYVPAAESLGWASLLAGDAQEAHAWLRGIWQNVEAKHADPRFAYGLSVALERTGDTEFARDLRDSVLAVHPDLEEWFTVLEQSIHFMRQLDEAPPEAGSAQP